MPNFRYRARNAAGKAVDGLLSADTPEQLAQKLADLDMVLIDARPVRQGGRTVLFGGRVKRRDLILFTNHVAVSLTAGVSLVSAMGDFAAELPDGPFRRIIEDLVRQVLAGATFSQALSRYPRVFPELYTAIVATGEATGNLDRVLQDLVRFLEWQEELIGQIKQATIYPSFLVFMIVLVITLMMTFTVPKFLPVLKSFNVELPTPTRILIAVAGFFSTFWPVLAGALLGFILVYIFTNRTVEGRYFWDRAKLALPLFGTLNLKLTLSKFAHYFSILFHSGISVLEAFMVIQRVVDNEVVRRSLLRARDTVEQGATIYDSLTREKIFPPLVLRMIQVGENTGKLDESLEKVSAYYDREVPATIKKIFATFEPALILVMGGVVLFIALAIFLPIYKLSASLGGQR